MPYDDPDATDPMTLTGVEVTVEDDGAVRDMAACFIEEYVRLGHGADAIMTLFACGEFAGPTMAFQQLGRDSIQALIDEQVALRGPRGPRLPIHMTPAGALSLPVLEG